jgi:hypothetical protein
LYYRLACIHRPLLQRSNDVMGTVINAANRFNEHREDRLRRQFVHNLLYVNNQSQLTDYPREYDFRVGTQELVKRKHVAPNIWKEL